MSTLFSNNVQPFHTSAQVQYDVTVWLAIMEHLFTRVVDGIGVSYQLYRFAKHLFQAGAVTVTAACYYHSTRRRL